MLVNNSGKCLTIVFHSCLYNSFSFLWDAMSQNLSPIFILLFCLSFFQWSYFSFLKAFSVSFFTSYHCFFSAWCSSFKNLNYHLKFIYILCSLLLHYVKILELWFYSLSFLTLSYNKLFPYTFCDFLLWMCIFVSGKRWEYSIWTEFLKHLSL